MIYVVKDGKILNRCDAWLLNAEGKMRKWISDNGYVLTDVEITFMGDMVMTVY